jgi:hypothetical protein
MDKQNFSGLLLGADLRTVRRNGIVVRSVNDQATFDLLFRLALHPERPLVIRAVDAVEKVTANHPEYLTPHKLQLLNLLKSADHKELKWHVAQLISRVTLTPDELQEVVHILTYWALNRNERKTLRVNALQGLFDLSKRDPLVKVEFQKIRDSMEHEMIPSIQARIRRLKKLDAKK